MLCRVVVIVGFWDLVFGVNHHTDTVDIFRFPNDVNGVQLPAVDAVHTNNIERCVARTGVERHLELSVGVTASVEDISSNVDLRTRCDVVVAQRDVANTKFRTNRPESYPLTLEVGVVGGQLGNRAGFGVGHKRELIAGGIVSRDVKSNEITGFGNDGSATGDVDHARPQNVLTVLLHAQQGGARTDGHRPRGVSHHPVDNLL